MAPIIAIEIIVSDLHESCCGISLFMRIIPYPPSFSKMAASTIDPATGASTWAFGSHIWRENSGSFTINAIISIIHLKC